MLGGEDILQKSSLGQIFCQLTDYMIKTQCMQQIKMAKVGCVRACSGAHLLVGVVDRSMADRPMTAPPPPPPPEPSECAAAR